MKIVIDTNLVASAIYFGGKPEKLIDLLINQRFDAYTNGAIIEEYGATTEVHVCRDPDDDKFIGCAIDSKSKYIVSGDKDLLAVGKHEDVEIVTVADFLKENFPND